MRLDRIFQLLTELLQGPAFPSHRLGGEVPIGRTGHAAHALQRLGFLLGETRYLDAAERTLRAAWKILGWIFVWRVRLWAAASGLTRGGIPRYR